MALGVLLVLGCLAILLMAFAVAWRGATELIYPPHRRAATSPADYHLAFENTSFTTRDGLTLRGWFIPAPNPQGTIVVCHGYTGECSPDLQYAPLLYQNGYNTLYFDFRGHGLSDGAYTSLVYFERFDLLTALDFLKVRGIERVALFGLSMGGAIALSTAPLSPMVVGVISDCTFAELWRVVERSAEKRGVPAGLAPLIGWLIVLAASLRLRANLFSADPIRRVGRIAPRPILLMHAANDDAAPVAEAHRLFNAAREPKELWIVPNAAHREIEQVEPAEYRRRVVEFFQRVFSGQ
jgi:fermentation-respiration switch protein FrsA (DUF1100 family)